MTSLPCRLALLAMLLLGATAAPAALDAEQRDFVDEMVRKHGYDRVELPACSRMQSSRTASSR